VIVDPDGRRGRASSFGPVADAYERARPGYPKEAVRWLAGSKPRDVVDLGAGTGKLTRSLVALGHRVTAVEPLEEMLAHLRRAAPGATAAVGRAEEIPLADGSVDVVVCAQAFHWFDHGAALPEIARVLRPGGRLALVWNSRDDREPWVARLSELIGSESVTEESATVLRRSVHFDEPESARFAHVQRLDRGMLQELVLSRSYCAVRTPEERAPVLGAVDALFDEHGDGGTIELPYLTECFRARLR
jgi:ubiquinone/menaquinone biosynthesis C-methylase UbiE